MTQSMGNLYQQSAALADSFVKTMKLVVKDKAPLFQNLRESKATQKIHTWNQDSVAQPGSNNASGEGSDTTLSAPADFTVSTNYTQIIKVGYSISGTQAVAEYQGVEDYLAYQKGKAMKKLTLDLEYALVNGTGAAGNNTTAAATAREMRGLAYWCTAANTANLASGANWSGTAGQAALDDVLALMYADGGSPDTVLCSITRKRGVDEWTSGVVKNLDATKKKLINTIAVYESSMGTVELLMHTMCGDTNIYAFEMDSLKIAYLRKPFSEMLGKSGDAIPFHCVTEATLEARNTIGGVGAVICL